MEAKEVQALVSLLDDQDPQVFEHVNTKIRDLGSAVVPVLESVVEDDAVSELLRERVYALLQEMQADFLESRLQKWFAKGGQDLLEGMWIMNTLLDPELPFADLKTKLDQMYYEFWVGFKKELHPVDQVKKLNGMFFGKLRFSANTKDFHAPSNSMIFEVLHNRTGNPITLCVIYLLISRRLKLPIYGVNLPNLFVLTYKTEDVQFYINVYNKGLIFSRADVSAYVDQLKLPPKDEFFEPCSHKDIILRVMRNLLVSFRKLGNEEKIQQVSTLLAKHQGSP